MDTLNVRPYVRPLGRTGLLACPLGFGGYCISEENALHETALRAYLDRGGNLLDTSANYGDDLSEQLLGRILKNYPRDQIVVVTKGGYIQEENMALARSRSFSDVVRQLDGEAMLHCFEANSDPGVH